MTGSAASGEERLSLATQPGFACLTFLADGERLATADAMMQAVWNVADGKSPKSILNALGAAFPFMPMVMAGSPDGRILAEGALLGGGPHRSTVRLLDLTNDRAVLGGVGRVTKPTGEKSGVATSLPLPHIGLP